MLKVRKLIFLEAHDGNYRQMQHFLIRNEEETSPKLISLYIASISNNISGVAKISIKSILIMPQHSNNQNDC
jgi:hypothetical protein